MRRCGGAGIHGGRGVRKATIYGYIGGYGYGGQGDVRESLANALRCEQTTPDLWLTPNCSYQPTGRVRLLRRQHLEWRRAEDSGYRRIADEASGATGVLQAIAACLWLHANGGLKAVATSGAAWNDGSASLVIGAGVLEDRP